MRKYFLILVFLFMFNPVSATYISEIMYNPEGSDNNLEYIEIITDLNLENFTISDSSSSDILEKVKSSNNNIALIVEEDFNYSDIDANIYSAGAAIGNNLNNDEDIIILINNSEILDYLHYYSSWGADSNGKSLSKLTEQSLWQELFPSPGTQNSETQESYDIFISEFLPDPEGDDDASMPLGEWIEIYNKESSEINLENFYFIDNANHKLTISNQNTNTTIINSKEFLVIYMNGFFGLLNNEDFEKIFFYSNQDVLIDSVSYSETKEGLSISKIENNLYHTKPSPGQENFKETEEKNSDLSLDKLYLGNDNKAHFGDLIRVKVSIYKGETTQNEIDLFLEKDSERLTLLTKFSVPTKFSNNELTIPLQIPLNCDNKLEAGTYQVVLEGLKDETSKDIEILPNENCIISEISSEKTIEKKVKSESIINNNFPQNSTTKQIYESQGKKSENYSLLIFTFALCLTILGSLIQNDIKS